MSNSPAERAKATVRMVEAMWHEMMQKRQPGHAVRLVVLSSYGTHDVLFLTASDTGHILVSEWMGDQFARQLWCPVESCTFALNQYKPEPDAPQRPPIGFG